MLKPMNTYILVDVKKEEEKTAGGLYVPQSANHNPNNILKEGTIVAVSKKAEEEGYAEGQVIYFNKHAVTTVPTDDTKGIVRMEDVYAVL